MSPDLHHLSGAYSVDALETDERTAFEQHLAVCPACRAEVTELTEAAHAVGALSDTTPPSSLRADVLAAIGQVRPLPPTLDPTRDVTWSSEPPAARPTTGGIDAPPRVTAVGEAAATTRDATVIPFARRTTTWIAAAAAAAVIAVGGAVWGPWADDQPPRLTAIQQVEQAKDATTVTKNQSGITATVAFSRSLDRSALTVEGMPPAPQGKVYQLWYIGAGGARSAGFMTAGQDGAGEAVLAGSLMGAQKVGVTVEPAGGSASPTTEPVMVVALV